jgi:hypothetical protein
MGFERPTGRADTGPQTVTVAGRSDDRMIAVQVCQTVTRTPFGNGIDNRPAAPGYSRLSA